VSKREVLIEFVAVLARLLTRQGNKVGAILFDGINRRVLPPRGGRRHVLQIIDSIARNPRLLRAPQTDLGAFFGRAPGIVQRRSLMFAISDFVSSPGWEKGLSMLARKHEVLAVRLVDPVDMSLPDIGLLPFEDAESGEQILVDTADRAFRRRFTALSEQREAALFEGFAAAGCDVLELSTYDDLIDAIRRFADLRKAQQSPSGGGSLAAHLLPEREAEAAP
jgi:uncharacterized protein (DUF58 family)